MTAVFPGGFLPTLAFLIETLNKGSHGRLVVDAVSNIGPHYARTLREWRRRFEARFEDTIVPGESLSFWGGGAREREADACGGGSAEGGVPGGDGHGRREGARGDRGVPAEVDILLVRIHPWYASRSGGADESVYVM